VKATFKVHRVDPRDVVHGVVREERVLLHTLDPHEPGVNELTHESRSGEAKIQLKITGEALGSFRVGQFVEVTFDVRDPQKAN